MRDNELKHKLQWNEYSQYIAFLDEEGYIEERKGKIIQSKNGYCFAYFENNQRQFLNLEEVYYGTMTKAGEVIYLGSVIEVGDKKRLIEWGNEEEHKHLMGYYEKGIFQPVYKLEEHVEILSYCYEDEELLATLYHSEEIFVHTINLKGKQMILMKMNGFESYQVSSKSESVISNLFGIMELARSLQPETDILVIKQQSSFLSAIASGQLLENRLKQNNLVFGNLDLSGYKNFLEEYISFIKGLKEKMFIDFKVEKDELFIKSMIYQITALSSY